MMHTRISQKSLKNDFLKQPVIAKDEIKVSTILANKSEVKAKNLVILISFYGNKLVVTA